MIMFRHPNDKKLAQLADIEDYILVEEMLEDAITKSVVPGICTVESCDYATEVEPDCEDGWCEECEDYTVQSCLVLARLI